MRWIRNRWYLLCTIVFCFVCAGCSNDDCCKDSSRINRGPQAVLCVQPEWGTVDTLFAFNASESRDRNCPQDTLLFRWDFDGDGCFDTPFTPESAVAFRYPCPGEYSPTVQVQERNGLTDSATRHVSVRLAVVISPQCVTLSVGQTIQFGVQVAGCDDTRVVWSASGGTVVGGVYTAPKHSGEYYVTATSVADPHVSATAVVSVQASYLAVTIN